MRSRDRELLTNTQLCVVLVMFCTICQFLLCWRCELDPDYACDPQAVMQESAKKGLSFDPARETGKKRWQAYWGFVKEVRGEGASLAVL